MKLEKLLSKKEALEQQIAQLKAVEKNLDKVRKLVVDLVDANPKLALIDRAALKEKLNVVVQEAIAGL